MHNYLENLSHLFNQSNLSVLRSWIHQTKITFAMLISRVDHLLKCLHVGLCKNTSVPIEAALKFRLAMVCVKYDDLNDDDSRDEAKNDANSDKSHGESKGNTVPIRSKR